MVFACVAVVTSDSNVDAADATTYLHGEITSSQDFVAGTNVVVDGHLAIPENMTLTIAGKLTVNEGYTLTVEDGGKLIIKNGASAIFNGNLVLENGSIFMNSAVTDNTNEKLGSPLGVYINGNFTVEKGAYITGVEVSKDSALTGDSNFVSGTDCSSESIADCGTVTGKTNDTTGVIEVSGWVAYHMNAAGKMGYWIGYKVTGTADANAQVKYDGRASTPADHFDSEGKLTIWINVGAGNQTITYNDGSATKTLVFDFSHVVLGSSSDETASNPGEIVIGSNSVVDINSTKTSPSLIADQTIYMVAGASVDIDSITQNVTVAAYTDSGIYTYGSVTLDNATDVSIGADGKLTPTTVEAQNLTFSVSSEKISSAFNGTDKTTKAYNLILDVAGTIGTGYTMTVNCNDALAGAYKDLFYPDSEDADVKSNVPMKGIVSINGNLAVGSGATLTVEPGANVEVSEAGKITDNGKKDAGKATLNLYGNLYVAGNVTLGSVDGTDKVVDLKLKDTAGAYLIIVGDGVISVQDYEIDYANAPAGTYGATYTNSDDAFIVTSLSKALTDAVADDVTEVQVWGIDATVNQTGTTILPMPYIVDANLTIPGTIELTVNNALVINENVTLTIEEDADVSEGTGVIVVEGTLMDYSMENRAYQDYSASGMPAAEGVYVDAEVKFVDADETYYMYTTLATALAGEAGTIELFGNVEVENRLTIPSGFIIDLNGKTMTVKADGELTVDGIIDATASSSKLTIEAAVETAGSEKDAGILNLNNMIVNTTGTTVENLSGTEIPAFIANGTIGDFEDTTFWLAPSVAATNSATLTGITSQGKITYSGALTFAVGEDNEGEVISIVSEVSIGNIVLNGFGFEIDTNGTFTGTVGAAVTAGDSSVTFDKAAGYAVSVVTDESGEAPVTTLNLGQTESVTMSGKVTIAAGSVELASNVSFGDKKTNVLIIAEGATLVVPEKVKITIEDMNDGATNVADKDKYTAITVDGTLTIEEGADFEYAGTGSGSKVYNAIVEINGTMNVADDIDVYSKFYVNGTLAISTTEDEEGSVTVYGVMYVDGTVTGAVNFAANSQTAVVIVYAGASIDTDNLNIVDGESTAEAMEVYVNGSLYMTVYGLEEVSVETALKYDGFDITGYETVIWPGEGVKNATPWYSDAEYQNKIEIDQDNIGETPAAYVKLDPKTATVQVSVGPQMSVFVDGVRVDDYLVLPAPQNYVGDHVIEVTINPGFTGDVTITFNGQTIENGGTFTITPQMADAAADNIVLSVTGNLTQSATVVEGGDSGSDGMGLTDYLLIILVILIVVMAIMVAMRLMRS